MSGSFRVGILACWWFVLLLVRIRDLAVVKNEMKVDWEFCDFGNMTGDM